MFNQTLNFRKQTLSDMSINNGMPNMAETLTGWEIPLNMVRITQSIVDGDKVETETNISFMGVWQPLSTEELQSLPVGERSWSHYWLHARSEAIELNTNDVVIFQNNRYKVTGKKDYGLNGFSEYMLVEDYENLT